MGAEYNAWRRKWKAELGTLALVKRLKKAKAQIAFELSCAANRAWSAMQADPLVSMWIGISWDEVHRISPSREPWIRKRFPMIETRMTRKQCGQWMSEHGYPEPPRSACEYCPYHGDGEWLHLKLTNPEGFERAAKFEDEYQVALAQVKTIKGKPYLHRSFVPLREIDFERLAKDKSDLLAQQPDFFGEACEGMCGV